MATVISDRNGKWGREQFLDKKRGVGVWTETRNENRAEETHWIGWKRIHWFEMESGEEIDAEEPRGNRRRTEEREQEKKPLLIRTRRRWNGRRLRGNDQEKRNSNKKRNKKNNFPPKRNTIIENKTTHRENCSVFTRRAEIESGAMFFLVVEGGGGGGKGFHFFFDFPVLLLRFYLFTSVVLVVFFKSDIGSQAFILFIYEQNGQHNHIFNSNIWCIYGFWLDIRKFRWYSHEEGGGKGLHFFFDFPVLLLRFYLLTPVVLVVFF